MHTLPRCRDAFAVGGLYLAGNGSPAPRTGCDGKGGLKKEALQAAGLDLAALQCALHSPQGAPHFSSAPHSAACWSTPCLCILSRLHMPGRSPPLH